MFELMFCVSKKRAKRMKVNAKESTCADVLTQKMFSFVLFFLFFFFISTRIN